MAYPVAVAQISLEPGAVDDNRATIAHFAQDAVSRGAKLVLFPEASVSDLFRGAEKLAETVPGPTTEWMQQFAGDATLVLPLLERASDGKVYSACVFLARDGVKGIARKTHFYRDSRGLDSFQDADVLARGSELSVIDVGGVKCGVLLGYDAEFPEAFRTLALKGADLILVAQNQLEPDYGFLSAMAARNRVPLLVANRLGFRRVYPQQPEFSAGGMALLQDKTGAFLLRCKGHSGILNASGVRVAQPAANTEVSEGGEAPADPKLAIPLAHFQEEEVLVASLPLEELKIERLTSPFIAERQAHLYAKE